MSSNQRRGASESSDQHERLRSLCLDLCPRAVLPRGVVLRLIMFVAVRSQRLCFRASVGSLIARLLRAGVAGVTGPKLSLAIFERDRCHLVAARSSERRRKAHHGVSPAPAPSRRDWSATAVCERRRSGASRDGTLAALGDHNRGPETTEAHARTRGCYLAVTAAPRPHPTSPAPAAGAIRSAAHGPNRAGWYGNGARPLRIAACDAGG